MNKAGRVISKVLKVLLMSMAILILVIASWCGYHLVVDPDLITTRYTLTADVNEPIRIVHLTDLHNHLFGNHNEDLVKAVKDAGPDMIFMTGDMLNRDDPNTSIVTELIAELKTIAPVYFGYGNHEKDWEENYQENLKPLIEEAGAVVVDVDYVDVEVNSTKLRIGGYMPYYRQPGMLSNSEEQKKKELEFADSFEDTERLKLLLNHIPTQWVDWNYIDKYKVDFVFAGHYHGGIVHIPIINSCLYCPYTGPLTKNCSGLFEGQTATCILSSGLGSEHIIPRINNPEEIVIVDLLPSN